MSLQLRTIKRELRILGIDTCNPALTVGVVNRGGSYLDGVIGFMGSERGSGPLAKKITESKYFPELRLVMIHDPSKLLDTSRIERTTGLPSMAVSTVPVGRAYRVFLVGRQRLWIKTRLDTTTIQRILSLTWKMARLPEPLRVAHILARSCRLGRSNRVKDKSLLAS
jgi:hypothetical protein